MLTLLRDVERRERSSEACAVRLCYPLLDEGRCEGEKLQVECVFFQEPLICLVRKKKEKNAHGIHARVARRRIITRRTTMTTKTKIANLENAI